MYFFSIFKSNLSNISRKTLFFFHFSCVCNKPLFNVMDFQTNFDIWLPIKILLVGLQKGSLRWSIHSRFEIRTTVSVLTLGQFFSFHCSVFYFHFFLVWFRILLVVFAVQNTFKILLQESLFKWKCSLQASYYCYS